MRIRARVRQPHAATRGLKLVVFLCGSLSIFSALAQPGEAEITALRQSVNEFSTALAGGLGLDAPGGLFGTSVGSIQARYLFAQGVYLEVRSPLANRRQRPSLAALDSTLRQLQLEQNPFSRLSASAPSALATVPEPDPQLLTQMTDRLQQLDYELIVGAALSEAERTAERLRSLEGIDQQAFQALQEEFDGLRQRFADNVALLDGDQSEARTMQERLTPLRELVTRRANELQQQLQAAQENYVNRWLAERDEFEAQLYAAACREAGDLASLDAEQRITVVLMGLGDEGARARPDRIHVMPVAALRSCLRGEMSVEKVAELSTVYSY